MPTPTAVVSPSPGQASRAAGRLARACTLVCMLAVLPSASALAQQTDVVVPRGSIAGITTIDSGRPPVAGAVVELSPTNRLAQTDSLGEFRFTELVPGRYTLLVRKLGFVPVRSRVLVEAGQVTELELRLLPSPQLLANVVVRGDSTHDSFALARAQRNAGASGTVLLRAELDSARGVPISELMGRRVMGTRLVRYGRTGATLVATSRGGFGGVSADPGDPRSPRACYAQVIVDGVRVFAPGVTRDAVPDLSSYDASRLEALEFYPGPSSTPVEYGGTGAQCGTIMLWLKASR